MKYPSDGALFIIDMLNDFVDEKGALYVPSGKEIVSPILEKKKAFKSQGLPVFYLNDSHEKEDEEFSLWPPHAVKGSWGAQVFPDLSPEPGDVVVEKRRYSGFFGTELDRLLKEKGVKKLYLTGLLTDVCVFFTAHDGYNLGYRLAVFSDSTTSLDQETHRKFLERMKKLFGAEIL